MVNNLTKVGLSFLLVFIPLTLSASTNMWEEENVETALQDGRPESEELEASDVLWTKQLNDYGRGSKYNKPPIRTLAERRLQKQVETMSAKCLQQNGTPSFRQNLLRWGCCSLNSSRPCLYPGYPYPQDPGGCVATVGALITCSAP